MQPRKKDYHRGTMTPRNDDQGSQIEEIASMLRQVEVLVGKGMDRTADGLAPAELEIPLRLRARSGPIESL